MFGIILLILLFLPLLFQLIFGIKSVREKFLLQFRTISLISIASQMVLSIVFYCITLHEFNSYFEQHPNQTKCGMPLLASLMLLVLLAIALIFIIIIQFFINRYWKK